MIPYNDEWLKENVEMEVAETKSQVKLETTKTECVEGFSGDVIPHARNEDETMTGSSKKKMIVPKIKKRHNNKDKEIQEQSLVKKKAAVSESATSGLCTMTCIFCSDKYSCWDEFKKHMKLKHNKIVIRKPDFEKYLTKATVHVCRICAEKVFCEGKHLADHFATKHKLNLSNYRKKYNCESWVEKLEKVLINGTLSTDTIGDLCTFQCQTCQQTFNGTRAIQNHSRECCPNVQAKFWVDYIREIVTHRCNVCSKLILCDRSLISAHVTRNHGFKNLDEYAKKEGFTYITNKELKQNLTFTQNCKSRSARKLNGTKYVLEKNVRECVNLVDQDQSKNNDAEGDYSLKKCLAKMTKSKSASNKIHTSKKGIEALSENNSRKEGKRPVTITVQMEDLVMKNAEVSENAETGLCTFTCPDCSVNYRSRVSFELHMKKSHNKHIKMTNVESCRFMTKATVHVCQICDERVFCEKTFLKGHFFNKHKLTLSSYRKNYNCGIYKEKLQKLLESGKLSQNKVGNFCSFKCPTCCGTYKGLRQFRNHRHNSKRCLQELEAKLWVDCLHGDIITHKCKICSKLLLCDQVHITKHCEHHHKISSFRQYVKTTGSLT